MPPENRKKVLIVDDSPTVRAQITGFLKTEFDCASAENGDEGLLKAREQRPDALVVDLEMPKMDGMELLRRLRADAKTRSVPVVIVTTVTSLDRVNECRALGCAGFVLKPLEPEYLKAKLRQLMRDGT